MNKPTRFGRRLKNFRELAGLSQNRLAKKSGVSRVTITLVESGRQDSMSIENALKIADALEVKLDNLVRGDEKSEMTATSQALAASRPVAGEDGRDWLKRNA